MAKIRASNIGEQRGGGPGGSWYAPRKELANLNVDAYFPDGVWCHRDIDTNLNYYCQNNLCMAEERSTLDKP